MDVDGKQNNINFDKQYDFLYVFDFVTNEKKFE